MSSFWEWQYWGDTPEEAAEVAGMLAEAAPHIAVGSPTGSPSAPKQPRGQPGPCPTTSLKERLRRAVPMSVDPKCVDWRQLVCVASHDMLSTPTVQTDLVEVSSGGHVFFCFFKSYQPSRTSRSSMRTVEMSPPQTPESGVSAEALAGLYDTDTARVAPPAIPTEPTDHEPYLDPYDPDSSPLVSTSRAAADDTPVSYSSQADSIPFTFSERRSAPSSFSRYHPSTAPSPPPNDLDPTSAPCSPTTRTPTSSLLVTPLIGHSLLDPFNPPVREVESLASLKEWQAAPAQLAAESAIFAPAQLTAESAITAPSLTSLPAIPFDILPSNPAMYDTPRPITSQVNQTFSSQPEPSIASDRSPCEAQTQAGTQVHTQPQSQAQPMLHPATQDQSHAQTQTLPQAHPQAQNKHQTHPPSHTHLQTQPPIQAETQTQAQAQTQAQSQAQSLSHTETPTQNTAPTSSTQTPPSFHSRQSNNPHPSSLPTDSSTSLTPTSIPAAQTFTQLPDLLATTLALRDPLLLHSLRESVSRETASQHNPPNSLLSPPHWAVSSLNSSGSFTSTYADGSTFIPHRSFVCEGVAVVKFARNRLLMQAEQFANELSRYLGICAPECRIIRQHGASAVEWHAAQQAGQQLNGWSAPDFVECMQSLPCMLVMEYIKGAKLFESPAAFGLQSVAGIRSGRESGACTPLTSPMVRGIDSWGWSGGVAPPEAWLSSKGPSEAATPEAGARDVKQIPVLLKNLSTGHRRRTSQEAEPAPAPNHAAVSKHDSVTGSDGVIAGKRAGISGGDGTTTGKHVDLSGVDDTTAAKHADITVGDSTAAAVSGVDAHPVHPVHALNDACGNYEVGCHTTLADGQHSTDAYAHARDGDPSSVHAVSFTDNIQDTGNSSIEPTSVAHTPTGEASCCAAFEGKDAAKGHFGPAGNGDTPIGEAYCPASLKGITESDKGLHRDVHPANPKPRSPTAPSTAPPTALPTEPILTPSDSPRTQSRAPPSSGLFKVSTPTAENGSAGMATSGHPPGPHTLMQSTTGTKPFGPNVSHPKLDTYKPPTTCAPHASESVTPSASNGNIPPGGAELKGGPSGSVEWCWDSVALEALVQTMRDLGRLLLLDMLLGNADRLPCAELGWRGNTGNLMFAKQGGKYSSRMVAIDSCVQRRPPESKSAAEDQAIERLTQLVLADVEVAKSIIQQLLSAAPPEALCILGCLPAVAAFQHGLKDCLGRVIKIKGLLDMIYHAMDDWISEFLADIRDYYDSPQSSPRSHHTSSLSFSGGSHSSSALRSSSRSLHHSATLPSKGFMQAASPVPVPAGGAGTVSPAPMGKLFKSPSSPVRANSTVMSGAGQVSTIMLSPRSFYALDEERSTEGHCGSPVPAALLSIPLSDLNGISPSTHSRGSSSGGGHGASGVNQQLKLTMRLKKIGSVAKEDNIVGARLQYWKRVFKDRGVQLREAVDAWQEKQHLELPFTTGFLDGTHPIVDAYELKVRLDHMLRRLRALQNAAVLERPTEVTTGLFVGNAVSVEAHHMLRHLGITHIVNSTEEVISTPDSAGFVTLRVPLRDEVDACIQKYFDIVNVFIDGALSTGGGVLVHCSEGRSRSVTLVLAYLMMKHTWTLRSALDYVQERRPIASPNDGFLEKLLQLDTQLHGKRSMKVVSKKPQPLVCPMCGATVGISAKRLAVHLRSKHNVSGGADSCSCYSSSSRQSSVMSSPKAAGKDC